MKRLLFITLLLFPCLAQAQHTLDINVWNLDWPTTYTPEIDRKRRASPQPYIDSAYWEYKARAGQKALTQKQYETVVLYPYDLAKSYPSTVNIGGIGYAHPSSEGFRVVDWNGMYLADVEISSHIGEKDLPNHVIFITKAHSKILNLSMASW